MCHKAPLSQAKRCLNVVVNPVIIKLKVKHALFKYRVKNNLNKEKKEEIWLSPMAKAPLPQENTKVERQHKDVTKNFDYSSTTKLELLVTSNSGADPGILVRGVQPSEKFW